WSPGGGVLREPPFHSGAHERALRCRSSGSRSTAPRDSLHETHGGTHTLAEINLSAWQETPEASGVICGFHGVLAEEVDQTRRWSRLAVRFGLAAIVADRRARAARRVVGRDVVIMGNRGLETLLPGDLRLHLDPDAEGSESSVRRFAHAMEAELLDRGA